MRESGCRARWRRRVEGDRGVRAGTPCGRAGRGPRGSQNPSPSTLAPSSPCAQASLTPGACHSPGGPTGRSLRPWGEHGRPQLGMFSPQLGVYFLRDWVFWDARNGASMVPTQVWLACLSDGDPCIGQGGTTC